MDKKIILGIDTSTDNCSVALLIDNQVIERNEIAKSAHSEKLIQFIGEILEEASVSVKDLTSIGVNIGPGSFTGLRIGLSTAKGLAFPNKIPILPVKSLPVLVQTNNSAKDLIYFIKSHKNMIFYNHFTDENSNMINMEVTYGDINEVVKNNPETKIIGTFDFVENFQTSNNVIFPTGKSVTELVSKYYDNLVSSSEKGIEPYYLTSFLAQKWSGNK